jgi:hypothetical protein
MALVTTQVTAQFLPAITPSSMSSTAERPQLRYGPSRWRLPARSQLRVEATLRRREIEVIHPIVGFCAADISDLSVLNEYDR